MRASDPRGVRLRSAWAAILAGLLLAAAGCASIATGIGRSGPPPAPVPAFDPPAATEGSTSPPLYWMPAWRMYLREGDVVEQAGRHYVLRSGQWHVAELPAVPGTAAASAGGEAPRRDAEAPAADGLSSPAAPDRRRHGVVTVAMRYVGTPYAWGGTSPAGFDCSGFVQYVYGKLGLTLPRTVREQYAVGVPVPRSALAVGDVVFFDRLRHNGIYVGDGRFIHATKSGDAVRVSSLDEGWFRQRWVGARRLPSGRPVAGGRTLHPGD